MFQQSLAEGNDAANERHQHETDLSEDLSVDFLEVLGSVEDEEDDWFELFLLTIDEAEAGESEADYE